MIQLNVGLGKVANDRLLLFAKNYHIDTDLNEVSIKLMRAHSEATAADLDGWLSPRVIAEYHHIVYQFYGLPTNTFGGTPIFGSLWEADYNIGGLFNYPYWCKGCAPR